MKTKIPEREGPMQSPNEMDRLMELSDFGLNYVELQDELAGLTDLATKITGARVSMVNLIDCYTQWTVARTGSDIEQMPREESVCQYTIQGDEALEISDLSVDARSKDKSYVTAEGGLRYYYGIPLKTKTGEKLGALCVLDKEPKQLAAENAELLQHLADAVMARLELMRDAYKLRQAIRENLSQKRKICHDIRSPLSGVVGLSDMACEQLKEEGNEEMAEMIGMIRDSSRSVMDLAEEVLEEKHSDDVETQARVGLCTLDGVRDSIAHLFTPQAVTKGVSLKVDVKDGHQQLVVSRSQLLQVAGNLISNAIKFTPENGSVEVSLGIHPEQGGHVIRIVVSDTGVGMSQEACQQVLDMEAESKEGTSGESGYGLGLKFVQKLVSRLGGRFRIDSKEGEGCRMVVDVPLV